MIRLISLLLCAAFPALAQTPPDTGEWFASYVLEDTQPGVEMTVQVMQIGQSPSADVVLDVYKGTADCPQALGETLCAALPAGVSSVQASGARIYADELRAVFAFPGQSGRWLLRLMAAGGGKAEILHELGGRGYSGTVLRGPHLCEQAMCSRDVFDALRSNPFARLGDLADDAWTQTILERAGPAAPVPAQEQLWDVLRPNGDFLGQINLSGKVGQGTFDAVLPQGPARADLSLRKRRDTAEDWFVTLAPTGTGAPTQGRLLLDREGLRGTLVVGDVVQIVVLAPLPEDDPANDLPGFGIYAPEYALRGVPSDRSLWVRAAPDPSAATTTQLSPTARGLFVFACTPEPDNIAFDLASRRQKEEMLDALWCEIGQGASPSGWVRGKYLSPVQR